MGLVFARTVATGKGGCTAARLLNATDQELKPHPDNPGLINHCILTGDHPPIKQQAYRTYPGKHREMDRLLQDGIIEESCPWSSPVVLVRKIYCLELMTIDALAGATWFSTLDLSDGYWQVEVAQKDCGKKAFTTGQGLYQFELMPMGLTNAPATLQQLVELVLKGLPRYVCTVYLYNILIYSRLFEEDLSALGEVFSLIGDSGLQPNARKCHLARDHVIFLRHVISAEGLRPDPKEFDKVKSWPPSLLSMEVHAFLGLSSYYRRFQLFNINISDH